MNETKLKWLPEMFYLFTAVISVFAFASFSYAQETVIWGVADRPTSYILYGKDKGKGVVDEVYKLLQTNLSEYQHENIKMNFSRVLREMKNSKKICACGFKKPEREELGYFSKPAIIALPFSVIVKKGRLKKIYGDVKSLSLAQLFQNSDLKGGVTKKRSYGAVTPMIDEQEKKGELLSHTTTDGLLKMIARGRIDYAIEIPSFANYISKQFGLDNGLESYAINENKTQVLIAYIFCTRNEWGRKIIEDIDTILEKQRGSASYLEYLVRWYDDRSRLIISNYHQRSFTDN